MNPDLSTSHIPRAKDSLHYAESGRGQLPLPSPEVQKMVEDAQATADHCLCTGYNEVSTSELERASWMKVLFCGISLVSSLSMLSCPDCPQFGRIVTSQRGGCNIIGKPHLRLVRSTQSTHAIIFQPASSNIFFAILGHPLPVVHKLQRKNPSPRRTISGGSLTGLPNARGLDQSLCFAGRNWRSLGRIEAQRVSCGAPMTHLARSKLLTWHRLQGRSSCC